MIKITSPDGAGVLEVLFDGNDPFAAYGSEFIGVECRLMYRGQSARTKARYSRDGLGKFGCELSKLHSELNIGAAASNFSSSGNVAMSFVLGIRGSLLVSVVLVEFNRRSPQGLYAQITLDQSYLPEIARQVEKLSREYPQYLD